MKRKRHNNIVSCGYDLLVLGIESQQVMALRVAKLSRGGKRAQRESARMLTEKMGAGMTVGMRMIYGASPARILKGYRSKVRANIKRLSK